MRMPDFELLRKNMVESQVRTSDVTDRRIIRAMLELPRERFLPQSLEAIAYAEQALPLLPNGSADTIPRSGTRFLTPASVLARLIQLADLDESEHVLEVGCGPGYSTAVLAKIVAHVTAIDSDQRLVEQAAARLTELGLGNAEVHAGDMVMGWPANAPYDAIVVGNSIPWLPDTFAAQIRDSGRVVAILQEGPVGRAYLYEKVGEALSRRYAFDAAAPVLPGFERKQAFAL
jgi:protein-L-isoaspartate(D-aspartate) O-methyltransferase